MVLVAAGFPSQASPLRLRRLVPQINFQKPCEGHATANGDGEAL